ARTHQRKVQCARYRRGRQCKHVHVGAQLLELLLHSYTEFLFLIYNHQPEVLELYVFTYQSVRTDDDVQLPIGQPAQRFLDLLVGFKPVYVIDIAWKSLEALRESTVVLHGQDGGWHQYGHLLAVRYGLECRADSYLRFA